MREYKDYHHLTLTPSELRVIALVAQGWGNEAIAMMLSCTVGNVQGHLTSIYGKIEAPQGVNQRVWVVQWYNSRHVDKRLLKTLVTDT